MNPPKYRILNDTSTDIHYIVSIATNEVLYQCSNHYAATTVCALWNANAYPTYRTDGTLDLDTPLA